MTNDAIKALAWVAWRACVLNLERHFHIPDPTGDEIRGDFERWWAERTPVGVTISKDPTSGMYCPANAAEWTALLAGTGIPNPTSTVQLVTQTDPAQLLERILAIEKRLDAFAPHREREERAEWLEREERNRLISDLTRAREQIERQAERIGEMGRMIVELTERQPQEERVAPSTVDPDGFAGSSADLPEWEARRRR